MLTEELEEQDRGAIVERRVLVEVAPVVQLGIRLPEELLVEAVAGGHEAFAQLGLALVEPDDRTNALVELDHVAELVGQDAVHVVAGEASGHGVHVDHLALRGELVDPHRVLVGRREVAGGPTRDARHQDVHPGIGVDAGRPLGAVGRPVGRIDLRLERGRGGLERDRVDSHGVLDPPLRVVGQDPQGRGHLHVLLGIEVVGPELRGHADPLVRRALPHCGERQRRHAVAALEPAGEVEEVGEGQRVLRQRGGQVLYGRARAGRRIRRPDASAGHHQRDDREAQADQQRT